MDHQADTGLYQLHKFSKQFFDGNLPELIKECNVLEEKPNASDPLSVFGNPVDRTFPVHTKSSTYLSALYLLGQDQSDLTLDKEAIYARVIKAAKYWGILPEIKALEELITTKSAAPNRELTDDDYAMVVDYGDEKVRRFPLVSPASVKQAAADLVRDRVQYPYTWRKQAARRILTAAMASDMGGNDIPGDQIDYLVKASGMYPADAESIAIQLAARSLAFPEDCRSTLRKVANVVLHKQGNIIKLCELIDAADRDYKKYSMYRHGMAMPEEVFFTSIPRPIEKSAADDAILELTTGKRYLHSDLKRAGIEPFTVLGPDYVNDLAANDQGDLDVEKAAEILPTMPRDEAVLVEKALNAVNVHPVDIEKSARMSNDIFDKDKWIEQCKGDVADDWRMTVGLRHPQDVHAGDNPTATV